MSWSRWTMGLALAGLACMDKGELDPDKGETDTEVAVDTDTDEVVDTEPEQVVPTPTGDPATVPLTGACPQETDFGGFLVENLFGFSIVDGTVTDGVVPITVLELLSATGDCTLERRNNPFCDPPCGAGETCTFEGECIPFPRAQDLGTVTIGGLVEPVAMEPLVPGYNYSNTTLPHPAFQPGDLIELRTGDGTYPGVELHGVGVEELISTDGDLFVQAGVDMDVTWTPPAAASRTQVYLQLTIDQHGLTPVKLRCEFDDDGTGTVPGSLLDQLVAFGVTGYPNATLKRQTIDKVAVGEGCMDFTISSPIDMSVDVDGFTPCRRTEDCPPGQTCDVPNEVCRE